MLNEKNLPSLIVILPIATLLLTLSLFLYMYIVQQKKIMQKNLTYIEKSYKQQILNAEKIKIDSELDILAYNCKNIENSLKPELKRRVNTVYGIMMSVYENNKNLPKERIKKIIKSAINPIRFNNSKGYFFIYSLNGTNILLPPDKSVEGNNLLNFKDAAGSYIIRQAAQLAKTKKKGFLEWYWYKPLKGNYLFGKSSMHKKIGYIRYFKPFNWFVGTGAYVDDEIEQAKMNFMKIYARKKRKSKKFFLALEFLSNKRVKIISSSIPIYRQYISKDTIKPNMCYMKEVFEIINSGKDENIVKDCDAGKAIFYYTFDKDINLVTISKIDTYKLKKIMDQAITKYKNNFKLYMKEVILFSIIATTAIGGLFAFVSRQVNLVFFKYQNDVNKEKQKLNYLASFDELTGIYNRRKFDEILDYEINMSKRYNQKLSLIMFDLDHFKKINDRYGHNIGDKVLRIIAKSVKRNVRLTDTFARWGGEEFFIILPKTSINEAVTIAEHLRKIIENIKFGRICKTTCSFGVTELKEGDTRGGFVKRADDAMYLAKTKGRNRVAYL